MPNKIVVSIVATNFKKCFPITLNLHTNLSVFVLFELCEGTFFELPSHRPNTCIEYHSIYRYSDLSFHKILNLILVIFKTNKTNIHKQTSTHPIIVIVFEN